MQSIVEIVRFCYKFIADHIAGITDATFFSCKNSPEMVQAQAIEVWTSIAEEELYYEERGEQHQSFIATIFNDLKDVILATFEKMDFHEDLLDDQWGVASSAASCLRVCAQLMRNDIVDPIVNYAGGEIQFDNDPKKIYVGLVTLGAIMNGPDSNFIYSKYKDALELLLSLLQHSSSKIRETAAWLFIQIAAYCPTLMDREHEIDQIVEITYKVL